MDIRTDKNVPISTIKALWDQIPFSQGRDPESIQLAIAATNLFVHGWDGERLVATARVITDDCYYATIWDVIVDPRYQRQGIGTRIVRCAVEPFLHRHFQFIALFSAEGKEPFYEPLGFIHHQRGMTLDESLWPYSGRWQNQP